MINRELTYDQVCWRADEAARVWRQLRCDGADAAALASAWDDLDRWECRVERAHAQRCRVVRLFSFGG